MCPDRGGLLVIKHLLAICCAASITCELELKTLANHSELTVGEQQTGVRGGHGALCVGN